MHTMGHGPNTFCMGRIGSLICDFFLLNIYSSLKKKKKIFNYYLFLDDCDFDVNLFIFHFNLTH